MNHAELIMDHLHAGSMSLDNQDLRNGMYDGVPEDVFEREITYRLAEDLIGKGVTITEGDRGEKVYTQSLYVLTHEEMQRLYTIISDDAAKNAIQNMETLIKARDIK